MMPQMSSQSGPALSFESQANKRNGDSPPILPSSNDAMWQVVFNMQIRLVVLLHLQLSVMFLFGGEPGVLDLSQKAIAIGHACTLLYQCNHAPPSNLVVRQQGWLGEWALSDIIRIQKGSHEQRLSRNEARLSGKTHNHPLELQQILGFAKTEYLDTMSSRP